MTAMQTEILDPVSDPAQAPRSGPRKVGSIAGTVAGIVEEFYPWNSFKIFGDEVAQIFRSRYEVKEIIRGRDVPEHSEAKISKEEKKAIFDGHASKMQWTLVGAAL